MNNQTIIVPLVITEEMIINSNYYHEYECAGTQALRAAGMEYPITEHDLHDLPVSDDIQILYHLYNPQGITPKVDETPHDKTYVMTIKSYLASRLLEIEKQGLPYRCTLQYDADIGEFEQLDNLPSS